MIFGRKRIGKSSVEIDIREYIPYSDYIPFSEYAELFGYPKTTYPVSVYDIGSGLDLPWIFAKAGNKFDLDKLAEKMHNPDRFLCVRSSEVRLAEIQGRIFRRKKIIKLLLMQKFLSLVFTLLF